MYNPHPTTKFYGNSQFTYFSNRFHYNESKENRLSRPDLRYQIEQIKHFSHATMPYIWTSNAETCYNTCMEFNRKIFRDLWNAETIFRYFLLYFTFLRKLQTLKQYERKYSNLFSIEEELFQIFYRQHLNKQLLSVRPWPFI